jgi:hypothetical protein
VPGQNAASDKPLKRFKDLTKKLLAVPKREVDELRAERNKDGQPRQNA